MSPDEIFVQIPAYRDRELAPTLLELYRHADRPERLRTCVMWQRDTHDVLPPEVRALPRLELVEVDYRDSEGCNWARRALQQRWDGEPFTLLLDSHHRFVPGWDTIVEGMWHALRQRGCERPLLTAYLPNYEPGTPHLRGTAPLKIYPFERDGGVLTSLTSYPIPFWERTTAPIDADFVSLHFIFTRGAFNRDVVFDPDIYFFGDEVLTGLRAFTHGYDLFHPNRVVGWHAYSRGTRTPHWDDHDDWRRQEARSLSKLRAIFTATDCADGVLGARRSRAEYERHIMASLAMP